jgi:predicted Zn-ribbon and HTH transcriptional regulator
VHRVVNAGGPEDQACYTCECGYVFQARVSTTVRCPHCRCQQVW